MSSKTFFFEAGEEWAHKPIYGQESVDISDYYVR